MTERTRLEKLRESCDRHGPEVEMSIRNATVRDLIDLVEAQHKALVDIWADPFAYHAFDRARALYDEFNDG